jgi:hypothetical protein
MEYLKIWTNFRESISPLNDAEKGRLFDAMLLYAETGEQPDFKGNERYIWPTAKQAIDRAAQKAETLRQNGSKGGRPPKPTESKENQTKPTESKENQEEAVPSIKIKKNNNIDVVVVEDNALAREEGPFGLTEEDVHASLTRDRQIEDAARSVGLQTTEAGMMRGRRLAEQYGTDALLTAIPLAVDRPTWAYVEGILRNGGKNSDHRGNRSKPDGEIRTDYEFLRTGAV